MKAPVSFRTSALIAGDSSIIVVGILTALALRLGTLGAAYQLEENNAASKILLITLICLVSLYIHDLYDYKVIADRWELRLRLVQALGISWIVLAILFYLVPGWEVGRGTALYSIAVTLLLLLVLRSGLHFLFGHPHIGERILIVGDTQVAIDAAKAAHRRKDAGYRVVGFLTSEFSSSEHELADARHFGRIDQLEAIVAQEKIDSVVIGALEHRGNLPTEALLRLRLAGTVNIEEFTSFFERMTGRVNLGMLRPSWLIFSGRSRDTQIKVATREIGYRLLAFIGLVVSLPIAVLTAVLIKLESAGPCLYRQARVGKNGAIFELIKFRSMKIDAEPDGQAIWAAPDDSRATTLGKIIRKIRVDEIPQFWNILRGEMSFIGPRPERPQFVSALTKEIPFYEHRHLVAPGLTGWAQIKYPYGASVEDARHKLEYDLYYIKNQSFLLDVVILIETIKTIIFGRGGR